MNQPNLQAIRQADLGISCLKQAVVMVLTEASHSNNTTLSPKDIQTRLGYADNPHFRIIVWGVLEQLIDDQVIEKVRRGQYQLRSKEV